MRECWERRGSKGRGEEVRGEERRLGKWRRILKKNPLKQVPVIHLGEGWMVIDGYDEMSRIC